MYRISKEDPDCLDARKLTEELSETLSKITGSSGKASFDANDVREKRSCFVVARTKEGLVVGCGAIRKLKFDTAEIKRMYARPETLGVGSAILEYLEKSAQKFGYNKLWLETRLVNRHAVNFYMKNGYKKIPNFGKYIGNPKAICLGKKII